MNTILLILNLASALGFTLALSSEAPGEGCARFDDGAAIIVCVDEVAKQATLHIFPILKE